MNLKFRINLIITLALLLVMLIGAWMLIDNARDDIRAEVDSTTVLALHLLDAEVSHYKSGQDPDADPIGKDIISVFRLQSLDNVRHLKIEFYDVSGRLRDSNKPSLVRQRNAPPFWFEKLINRLSPPLKPTRRTININQQLIGTLVITPDPSYEIAEIWHDTFGFFCLGFIFFFIVNILLYFAVGSALSPLLKIHGALTSLEQGDLKTRLPLFSLPELSSISKKFNAMAQTLETTLLRNQRLTQKIIVLQEDERKNIARELHDEIGQHLTAINIDATAILKAGDIKTAKISAHAISEIAMQMMGIVRDMLQRLRPASLDEMGLINALNELIETWKQRNNGIEVSAEIVGELDQLSEGLVITTFRIVQECLTNVAKHARASRVEIVVKHLGECISILIRDNGQGFDLHSPVYGFGLAGMQERAEGLGGKFQLISTSGSGMIVKVELPI